MSDAVCNNVQWNKAKRHRFQIIFSHFLNVLQSMFKVVSFMFWKQVQSHHFDRIFFFDRIPKLLQNLPHLTTRLNIIGKSWTLLLVPKSTRVIYTYFFFPCRKCGLSLPLPWPWHCYFLQAPSISASEIESVFWTFNVFEIMQRSG